MARDIYLSLISSGWEGALAKHEPTNIAKADVCTVDEFIADVLARSHLKPITLRRYAVKLRKMAADVAKVDAGAKGKARWAKFDDVNGGREKWRAKVEALSLGLLTTEVVSLWRNQYVAKAGADPIARKSAERWAASYIRAGRSLFIRDILAVLRVKLPPNPFAGVKVKDAGAQRYRSEINPEWLLACAGKELRENYAAISRNVPVPMGGVAPRRSGLADVGANRFCKANSMFAAPFISNPRQTIVSAI